MGQGYIFTPYVYGSYLNVSDDLYVRVLTLGIGHGLTWAAQVDIFKLVSSIFKTKNFSATKYLYLKRIDRSSDKDITRHIVCNQCDTYLGPIANKEVEKFCNNCQIKVPVKSVSNFFLSLSIEAQLKRFLTDENFVQKIQSHRFKKPRDNTVLSDIYDGASYKKLVADGVLSHPNNFSYTFFTDGVAFGRSGKKSIWPIYLTVNELTYEERFKYIVLAGLYVGTHPGQSFLVPFVEEANKLSTQGLDWHHKGEAVNSKVVPLCCVVDSGARYKILNFQSFHAKYGCTFCYKESVRLSKKYTSYQVQVSPPQLRTEASLREDLRVIYDRSLQPRIYKKPEDLVYRGVKGLCSLQNLEYFNTPQGFCVDYMHAVCVGVVKDHLKLCLNPKVGKRMWEGMEEGRIGMEHLIKALDIRIANVQANTSSFRVLRSMSHQPVWKAREYLVWILFYCVPCLTGLMKKKFVLHINLLSAAMNIFMQKSTTVYDLKKADELLWWYAYWYQTYFREKRMVFNIHLLTHIKTSIENFGPLWGHSAFPYEGQNHYLLKLAKNHSSVALEIARKFTIYQSLPKLCTTLNLVPETEIFVSSIIKHKNLVKCIRSSNNCILLGKPQEHQSVVNKCVSLPQEVLQCCMYYKRVLFQRNVYSTVDYCSSKGRNDACVFLMSGEYALIHNFLKCLDKTLLVDVQIIHLQNRPIVADKYVKYRCVKAIETFGSRKCVNIDDILEPCLLIYTGINTFVSRLPYGCTVE